MQNRTHVSNPRRDMFKPTDLREPGAIEKLIAFHRSVVGDARMNYDEPAYDEEYEETPDSGSLEAIVENAVRAALEAAGTGSTLSHNQISAAARRQAIAAASGQSAATEQSVAVAVRALEQRIAAGEDVSFDAVSDALAASGAEVIRDRRSTGRR